MLKSWTVENFKSISKPVTLNLAPLTIFAGENSSGKSTVIQSILLVAQTLQSRSWLRSVVLNGNITRLGSFSDILSNYAATPIISLGFELTPSPIQYSPLNDQKYVYMSDEYSRQVTNMRCQFSFSAENPEGRENLQLYPRLESTSLDISYLDSDGRIKAEDVLIRRRTSAFQEILAVENIGVIIDKGLEHMFSFSVERPKTYKPRRRDIPVNSGKLLGCVCRHFLPEHLAFSYDGLEAKCNRAIEMLLLERVARSSSESEVADAFDFLARNPQARELLFELLNEVQANSTKRAIERVFEHLTNLRDDFSRDNWRKVIRYIGLEQRRLLTQRLNEEGILSKLKNILKEGLQSETKLGYGPFDSRIAQSTDYIDTFFSACIKYVGPLRDEPKSIYPLGGGSDSSDVGYKGELTAAVLEAHRDTIISYIPSREFSKRGHGASVQDVTLLEAVQDWLAYMGVAGSVETSDKGKLGHELKISPVGSNGMHDLTHVGVGVSQLLPILVQALLMQTGTVLILEQPELHLHPRVQSRLADFLVSLSLSGMQCIVETHSEYLINKLRCLSANAGDDSISKNSIIYFVEKENDASVYKPISINEYGVIANWPKGFFDEAEALASETIKAAAIKRKQRLIQTQQQIKGKEE
jgi:predicted ATPase